MTKDQLQAATAASKKTEERKTIEKPVVEHKEDVDDYTY